MKSKHSLHKRVRDAKLGPGGWHCPCCAPAKRDRKKYLRAARRTFTHLLERIERAENGDD
jgi:uncharacterized C2H2 Zn-finger protein